MSTNPVESPQTLNSWPQVALGDVCDIVIGRTPRRDSPEFWGGPLPWAAIADLNGDLVADTKEHITELGAEACGARRLPAGTLLFSFKLTIGKMAFAGVDMYTNEAIAGLIPKSSAKIRPAYLRLALASADLAEGSSHAVKGRTLNLGLLRSLTVPLPSLSEQDRITAGLRHELETAAKLHGAVETQFAAAGRLASSCLDSLFSARRMEAWRPTSLSGISDIAAGVTLGRQLRAEGVRMVPYLRVANVKDGRLDLADLAQTPATEVEIARLALRHGDLVLTEGGDPDKLGRGTVWSSEIAECIHQNHIFRVRLDSKVANPVFVSAQFGSAYGKAYFASHAKQTTGIATINQKVLKGFPLRLPALEDQDVIAREYEEFVVALRSLSSHIAEVKSLANRLPAAFLRRTFSGSPTQC